VTARWSYPFWLVLIFLASGTLEAVAPTALSLRLRPQRSRALTLLPIVGGNVCRHRRGEGEPSRTGYCEQARFKHRRLVQDPPLLPHRRDEHKQEQDC
jgi:hypothetical protein